MIRPLTAILEEFPCCCSLTRTSNMSQQSYLSDSCNRNHLIQTFTQIIVIVENPSYAEAAGLSAYIL